jgi:hypothetical protein
METLEVQSPNFKNFVDQDQSMLLIKELEEMQDFSARTCNMSFQEKNTGF